MTWVKLDDQFPDHPKIVKAGTDAAWLHVCGLCYCGRFLTDGEIPKNQVKRLADLPNPMKLAKRLCDVGLWLDAGDAFIIHDFLDFNPSKEKVEAERAAARERMAKRGRNGGRSSAEVRANFDSTSEAPTRTRTRRSSVDEMYADDGFAQMSGDPDSVIDFAARLAR
jgi:hypothetical protein